MIITDITAEITRKLSLAHTVREPEIHIYIDDATFHTMRREASKRDVLDPHVNELIMDNTIMGCPVHQVYGKGHGWRVV